MKRFHTLIVIVIIFRDSVPPITVTTFVCKVFRRGVIPFLILFYKRNTYKFHMPELFIHQLTGPFIHNHVQPVQSIKFAGIEQIRTSGTFSDLIYISGSFRIFLLPVVSLRPQQISFRKTIYIPVARTSNVVRTRISIGYFPRRIFYP